MARESATVTCAFTETESQAEKWGKKARLQVCPDWSLLAK